MPIHLKGFFLSGCHSIPHKWWIHCRMVYVPMSYLYAARIPTRRDRPHPFIASSESTHPLWLTFLNSFCLSGKCIHKITMPSIGLLRGTMFAQLIFTPLTTLLWIFSTPSSGVYEMCSIPPLRRMGMDYSYKLICMEGRKHVVSRSRPCQQDDESRRPRNR